MAGWVSSSGWSKSKDIVSLLDLRIIGLDWKDQKQVVLGRQAPTQIGWLKRPRLGDQAPCRIHLLPDVP